MLTIGVVALALIAGGLLSATFLAGHGGEAPLDPQASAVMAEQIAQLIAASSELAYADDGQFGPRSLTVTRARLTMSDRGHRQRFDGQTISLEGLVYNERSRVEYIAPARGRASFDARA